MLKLCLDVIIFFVWSVKKSVWLALSYGSVWWIGSYLALSGDISSSRGSKTAEQRLWSLCLSTSRSLVSRQYGHSVILMILSTAVGAGNVAGHIRYYMASAGLCVSQQARVSSCIIGRVRRHLLARMVRCARGHARMTRLYDVIFVIFSLLCQHYAQCLCLPIMLKIMLA